MSRNGRGDVAGSGEAVEGATTYEGNIVRPGDTSPEGMREKALHVLGEMERRMGILGVGWSDATTTQGPHPALDRVEVGPVARVDVRVDP